MKKMAWLIIALALMFSGCDDPGKSESTDYLALSGVWDFSLTPEGDAEQTYEVTVENSGGSGVARVSVWGPDVADSATVIPDQAIDVACGAYIVFGDTAGFLLTGGDSWRVRISDNLISQPVPANTVDSVVGEVFTGGTYNCGDIACPGSAPASSVPYPTKGIGQGPRPGGQWTAVDLSQNGPNVNAVIPEQHVLTMHLGTISDPGPPPVLLPPLAGSGDTVTISYRRLAKADGENGDFFRVRITSGTSYYNAEYLRGADMSSGDTLITFSFPASPETQVDFTAGLSGQGDYVVMDDLEVSVGSTVVFAEDFEAGYGHVCSPSFGAASRFEGRYPDWRKGDFCVTALNALSGTYSAQWRGGSYRPLTGSIISGQSMSSIASLIGGGLFGGSSASELEGLFMETWEPVYTNHMTVFTAAEQSPGNLAGTFAGESQLTDCLEEGRLTASKARDEETDLSASYWVISLEGQAVDCEPALAGGNTLLFGDTLSTASGDTINMVQLGGYFMATESVEDDFGNTYGVNGLVSGTLVNMLLRNDSAQTSANGVGAIVEDSVQGVITGRMVFDGGRVCELTGQSAFRVMLIEK